MLLLLGRRLLESHELLRAECLVVDLGSRLDEILQVGPVGCVSDIFLAHDLQKRRVVQDFHSGYHLSNMRVCSRAVRGIEEDEWLNEV